MRPRARRTVHLEHNLHRYLSPITHRTGSLVDQPLAAQLRPDFWLFAGGSEGFDVSREGSIDAPCVIPTGSIRASDFPLLTIGIDYVERLDAAA
jgi:hypothetical protein